MNLQGSTNNGRRACVHGELICGATMVASVHIGGHKSARSVIAKRIVQLRKAQSRKLALDEGR